MLRAVALLAAMAASSCATELPIYCRLLSVALQESVFQPVLGDVNMSSSVHVPAVGNVNLSISHLEIAAANIVKCSVSVDEHGSLNVGVTQLVVDMKDLHWTYSEQSWPHVADNGKASANTTLAFNVTIDMVNEKHHIFALSIGELHVQLDAQHHPWLTAALEKLTNFVTPLVSKVVQLAAGEALDESLAGIYQHGACAFISDALKDLEWVNLQFTSYEPFTQHVPVIGDVNFSVNSTSISPPTSMECSKLGFNGTAMTAHIERVPFNVDFVWAYAKSGSSFWHNKGNGSAAVVGGALLYIDVIEPSKTTIKVDLPELNVQLKADSDAWMYKALSKVVGPLVRGSLQLFGGRVLAHYITKCLEDPTCPHVKPTTLEHAASALDSETVVVM